MSNGRACQVITLNTFLSNEVNYHHCAVLLISREYAGTHSPDTPLYIH